MGCHGETISQDRRCLRGITAHPGGDHGRAPGGHSPLRGAARFSWRGSDDLRQEIFHGAARSLPRFDPRLGSVRTWLLRIAFNLVSHERKRAHRRYEAL
ncbi:sigma factor [Sorangium sp. So ce1097]|uniref:sigma factor n=1 Tax=Sorangium sp. So ce1097 TaxID=3133330 RepID=UPI003F648B1A